MSIMETERSLADTTNKAEGAPAVVFGQKNRGRAADKLITVLLMVLLGAAIQLSFSNILTYLLEANEKAAAEYEQIVSPLLSMEPAMILRVGVFAPVTEEFLFRGGVFFLFRWLTLLISGVFFGGIESPQTATRRLASGVPIKYQGQAAGRAALGCRATNGARQMRKPPRLPYLPRVTGQIRGITNSGYADSALWLAFLRNRRKLEVQKAGSSEDRGTNRVLLYRLGYADLIANILQAALFGIYHGNIYQGCYAFLIGLLFGGLALSYHTILYGMIAHSSVNFFGLYMDRILPGDLLPPAEFVLTVGSVFVVVGIMYYVVTGRRRYTP
ncbi:MAG: CPBP family intramembrane metalloprotease [Lachnospiraceae bacterium]|nr:CPBP family intramembrane metalloprotease [Lachnospiraceae bacterium]